MATLIVGVMTVAALRTLGSATRSGQSSGNRAVAQGLAEDLLAEIMQVAYSDPDGTDEFGPDGSEDQGPRSLFDDVDDYHNWSSQPPQDRDGVELEDRDLCRRRVRVYLAEPDDLLQTPAGDEDHGVKRIHVIVEFNDQVVAERIAVRTGTP